MELNDIFDKFYVRRFGSISVKPDRQAALLFAQTEAAELLDALLRQNKKYERNNPRIVDIHEELFDTIQMIYVANSSMSLKAAEQISKLQPNKPVEEIIMKLIQEISSAYLDTRYLLEFPMATALSALRIMYPSESLNAQSMAAHFNLKLAKKGLLAL